MLAQIGIMSLCVAIGIVAAKLRSGVGLGVVLWLVISALLAVGGVMSGLVVFVKGQNRTRRRQDVESRGRRSAIEEGRHEIPEKSKDTAFFKVNERGHEHGYEATSQESEQVHEPASNARHRRDDDGVLMMRSAKLSRSRNFPILRIDTGVPRAQVEDDGASIGTTRHRSWIELQEIIERDTNRYLQGDGRSGLPALIPQGQQADMSTGNLAPTTSLYRQLDDNAIRLSVVQNPEQEQAYLEMRRQHFAAMNRNHFLGLDHGVLDEMAPRGDDMRIG